MTEHQKIEYKLSWRDEYLKWICGFANASGGMLYIGVDDNGKVQGVENVHKLLEDLPNKIVSLLGIVPDVQLLQENEKKYIEIVVQPSGVPISYKGIYHYRSGSTKQELSGNALHQFLLKRLGRSWDDLPCDNATLNDIDKEAVAYFFGKALRTKRIPENGNEGELQTVLENMNLITADGKLKNAALLLFGKRPSRFFSGVSFKIGRFVKGDDDLIFQDIIEGNIIQMAEKVMDVLFSKYLISIIHYEGLQRIERLELPEDALREAILNAIIHKDYTGAPIQLSVYNDKIILWNEGRLPENWVVETLYKKHPSKPYNKTISDLFFKVGFIEAWGRGISKIINGFIDLGFEKPVYTVEAGGIMLTINREQITPPVIEGLTDTEMPLSAEQQKEIGIYSNKVTNNVPLNVLLNVPLNEPVNVPLNEAVNSVEKYTNEPVNEPVNVPLKEIESEAVNAVNKHTNEPVNEPVNERQLLILLLIQQNNSISLNELSQKCKVGRETIKRDINTLKKLKIIERIGSDKTGSWKVYTN